MISIKVNGLDAQYDGRMWTSSDHELVTILMMLTNVIFKSIPPLTYIPDPDKYLIAQIIPKFADAGISIEITSQPPDENEELVTNSDTSYSAELSKAKYDPISGVEIPSDGTKPLAITSATAKAISKRVIDSAIASPQYSQLIKIKPKIFESISKLNEYLQKQVDIIQSIYKRLDEDQDDLAQAIVNTRLKPLYQEIEVYKQEDYYPVYRMSRSDNSKLIDLVLKIITGNPANIIKSTWKDGGLLPVDDPEIHSKINDAFNKILSIVNPDIVSFPMVIYVDDTGRNGANRKENTPFDHTIRLTQYWSIKDLAHDIGHAIEDHNPALHTAAIVFRQQRTPGERLQPLDKIYPDYGFEPDEFCRPDNFPCAYCGKVYDDGSTEIISMGLEYLFTDPVSFAIKDPNYFEFMVDIIQNRLGGFE